MLRSHCHLRILSLSVLLVQGAAGCKSRATAALDLTPSASAIPSAKAAPAIPEVPAVSPELVHAAVNPDSEKPYSGPIGGARGTVHISGGTAPELPEVLRQISPGRCADARAFYGKLFREGPNRELGDVLVAVTGYKGYLPAQGPAKVVIARGCAFESRTIALVFGQRLDVRNLGGETFIPRLVGAAQAALVVAVPGGDPAKIFPNRVGQYQLQDQTHSFATADVFVLKFPTFAVTGIDGKFDLSGIPAGEVTVSAYLPAIKKTASQKVNIVAGETANVDFTIAFDGVATAPSAR
jgi:hypothetical protein